MKNRKYLGLALLIITAIGFGTYYYTKPAIEVDPLPEINPEKFSGVITGLKTDCAFDGECSIFVDGREVVVTGGDMIERPPAGFSAINSYDNSNIGLKVDVYAKKIGPNKHTLIGDSKYYIKFSN